MPPALITAVSAACSAAALIGSALNAWQNVKIERAQLETKLSIQTLRLEIFKDAAAEAAKLSAPINRLETEAAMLNIRVSALEASREPHRLNGKPAH